MSVVTACQEDLQAKCSSVETISPLAEPDPLSPQRVRRLPELGMRCSTLRKNGMGELGSDMLPRCVRLGPATVGGSMMAYAGSRKGTIHGSLLRVEI